MQYQHIRAVILFSLFIGLAFVSGCSNDETSTSKAGTFATSTQDLGNGTVKSWVRLNDAGDPEVVGITLTDDVLKNLPQDTSIDHMLENTRLFTLPAEAEGTGINHVTLNWNPKGHEPAILYGKPHFDFHFYLITEAEQMAIAGGPDTFSIDPKYMPADYFTPAPVAVPAMGVHYVDSTDMNNAPGQFEHTFIYGFSQGKMIFAEPMITKNFLETKQPFTATLKLPQSYQRTGIAYPTKYSIGFDSIAKEHTITLEGFVKH